MREDEDTFGHSTHRCWIWKDIEVFRDLHLVAYGS
jgi:hypothetical protein